jgi:ribose transport system substrate-binding protein
MRLLVTASAALLVLGCSSAGATSAPATAGPTAVVTTEAPSPSGPLGATVVSQDPASISKDWVTWSTTSCSYEPAAQHPDTWTANLRAANGLLLGHMEQSEDNDLNLAKNASVKEAAQMAGFELLQVNGKYPDKASFVTAAQNIATRKPAAVIEDNPAADVAPQLNDIYKAACIPFVQLSLATEGAITFGASNDDIGLKEGTFLVDIAKKNSWSGADIVVVGTTVSALGPINARPDGCGKYITDNLPGATYDPLPLTKGTTDEVTTVMTNWLTAHPDAKYILGCVISGLQSAGIDNALLAAGRNTNAAVMNVGATQKSLDALPDTSAIVGSVDQGFAAPNGRYAVFAVAMAEDAIVGAPVPVFVYTPLQVLSAP